MTTRIRDDTVPRRTRAEEQRAREAARKEAEARSAAVAVCDGAIRSGCDGAGCTGDHARHAAGVIEALQMVLEDDTQAAWGISAVMARKYHWGASGG